MPQRLPQISAREQGLALAGFVVALVIVVVGNYNVGKGENGGTGPALFTSILCLVLTLALFGYVVPRAQNLDRTAVVLGALATVSIIAFWSGVAPVLAAAAVAVVLRAGTVSRAARVLTGLGIVVSVAALVITLVQA